jgi:membrane protease YdiL (CAAX protease family)
VFGAERKRKRWRIGAGRIEGGKMSDNFKQSVKPKWYIGIGALAVTIAFLLLGAGPIQDGLGVWGLAITELVILVIALAPPLIFKWKLSEIMPIKRIRLKQLAAVFILFIACYIVVNAVVSLSIYILPDFAETAEDMSSFVLGAPFLVSLLVMALTPAICEEALFRGLILHTLKDVKNPTVLMLIVAFLFGAFHLDLYRFLPAAIIGFVLTYIMVKTKNFLLPVIFHALNNGVSTAIGFVAVDMEIDIDAAVSISRGDLIFSIALAAVTPILFYLAGKMLDAKT